MSDHTPSDDDLEHVLAPPALLWRKQAEVRRTRKRNDQKPRSQSITQNKT
jgi:hypothetical protein